MKRFLKIFGIIFIESLFWFVVVFGVAGLAYCGLSGYRMYWRAFLALLILASSIGSTVLAFLVAATDVVFSRQTDRLYGVPDPPVRAEETIEIPGDAVETLPSVKEKLVEFGARILGVDEDSGTIRARKGFSFVTVGENMEVTVEDSGPDTVRVVIKSEPRSRASFIDFGQNLRNVKRMAALLEEL